MKNNQNQSAYYARSPPLMDRIYTIFYSEKIYL